MFRAEEKINKRCASYFLKMCCYFLAVCGLAVFVSGQHFSLNTYAAEIIREETEEDSNKVYDELKERIDNNWKQGMEDLEDVNPIEVTGNLTERLLSSIAAGLFVNLKSIKAGTLLIGLISFVLGSLIAISANKNKKIRRSAICIFIAGIPSIMLILVFGISWYISMFR